MSIHMFHCSTRVLFTRSNKIRGDHPAFYPKLYLRISSHRMPDNPRQADHSDIPSSRPSAGIPHSSGSSSGGHYNAPPQAGPPNKFKNIIIGSIATIVTSTIVFLITQSLKKSETSGDTYAKKKDATI